MIQTWSRESTETPIVEPKSQWFGSGFGQSGSTVKRGATPGAPNSAAAAAGAAAAAEAFDVAAALEAAPEPGGVAPLQAASNAPSEETSRSLAR